MAESKVEQGETRLAIGMHCRPGYIVCGCGAWNTVDQRTECYMCHKPLYAAAASLPESQPNGAFEQLRQIGAALGLDEETHGCDDLVEEVQRLKRMTESQPAPEMDYEKAAELLVKMARYVAIKSAEKMVSEWLRAHDARVQPARQAEIERLRLALQEIAKGKGRFSMDPYEHAYNTIEDMKKLAESALKESSHGK